MLNKDKSPLRIHTLMYIYLAQHNNNYVIKLC